MLPLRTIWLLLTLHLLLSHNTVLACEPADDGPIFGTADAIFAGRLVDYELEHFSTGERSAGLLTYEVDEVLLGELGDRVRVRWPRPINGVLPDAVSAPQSELVGVVLFGSDAHKDYWSDMTHLPLIAHEPMLVTVGCGDRLRVTATRLHIDAVRNWIATGEPTGISAYRYVTSPTVQITARTIRFWRWTALIAGVVMLSLITAFVFLIRRHNRAQT